ncbi:MAG: alanine--tRNA ligase [Proteobacteria bacterium]|nr:alanine--tRNA ligase [Pseudomonadota bacterium]
MHSLSDIRALFLNYFQKHGHEIVASSPLIPHNDPTLLFTNAGMVQFKDVFTGLEKRPYTRAVSAQKCLRAGGKHNDLENVGYTARHHTFFEMLGNFSFGDYFKEEAIYFAWNFITKDLNLPKEKLLVTVYGEDNEAAQWWKKIAHFPDNKIIRIPTSDNFWSMGDTGPCGPCSEIFYDHGETIPGGPPGSLEADGDRFVEIWNLVFMQYEQLSQDERILLPKPSVDTGMGLERIAAVLQGVHSNFETDLFKTLIQASLDLTGASDFSQKQSHYVIADHLRASAFLIADGILPSNEGRGYVLRRIMRRAMRHAHMLGAKEPLLFKLVPSLTFTMGQAYPELQRAEALITTTLQLEEERFRQTLDRGLKLLFEAQAPLPADKPLPGSVAFKLYDTYGFPLDLIQDVLKSQNRSVDIETFNHIMAEQKAAAKASWVGSGESKKEQLWYDLYEKFQATDFLGYETLEAEALVLALIKNGELISNVQTNDEVCILLNQTPFYGESGGQIGDTGYLKTSSCTVDIFDTQKKVGHLLIHYGRVQSGTLSVHDTVKLQVDVQRREAIKRHHSATHLLHSTLRKILGSHVIQKGSLVAPDRLRFDFTHNQPLTKEQIRTIEKEVNQQILQNQLVSIQFMSPDEAIHKGAIALFGEKYGHEVRVVSMKPFSVELCAGTHVNRTGDIGCFKIISESGVAAGIRRIEAITGLDVITFAHNQESLLQEICELTKSSLFELRNRIETLVSERKNLERHVADLKKQKALHTSKEFHLINNIKVVERHFQDIHPKDLKNIVDELKRLIQSGIVVVTSITEGKVSLIAGVTDDLTNRVSAIDIVKAGSEILGGKGGGGRPDLAQAGGVDPSKTSKLHDLLEHMLQGI